MKILLEELPHQQESLDAIIESFSGIERHSYNRNENSFSNPLIKGRYKEETNIDVKMETGTGKTYVYTRLMYELHQRFGLFKFVIVVPSPAIKEGTKSFIKSDYAKQHFSQFYENEKIDLNIINAGDFNARSGRKNFPADLINFVEGSNLNTNTIQVLLINAGMLNSSSMKKSDYDQTLIGGITSPIEAIQDIKPVVIIDEPHRFPRDKAYYKSIEALHPQMIVRFGATFPTVKSGSGKNKIEKGDYYRKHPQYNLNAIESFNDGLVKGIDIYYPKLTEIQAENRYKVDSVKAKELVLRQGSKSYKLGVGDNLAEIDNAFEGDITYAGSKTLSNDLQLDKGMELIPGTFRASYQELIIQNAVDKHFEIEQNNFLRGNKKDYNEPKIKTLSLFFIHSIKSYRDDDGWLKLTFEKILRKKITRLIREYELKRQPREVEYLDFLRATLADLNEDDDNQKVHAGYFGEDRGSGDAAIQAEVDDILKNKEKMLTFKDESGNWQTRRFLFSKWTLREGWDNPNVFVIAKLRTSGSENSKIQEVGRGLRLPVDENGHRIQQDEWQSRLAFLIGYDEKEFAKQLVGEINSDTKIDMNEQRLTEDMINIIVKEKQKNDATFDDERLLEHLDDLKVINRKNEFRTSVNIDGIVKDGYEWLLEMYPVLTETRLQDGKVQENDDGKTKIRVKLRKENWKKVKDLWRELSNRHMLEFQRYPERIKLLADEVIGNSQHYEKEYVSQVKESLNKSEDEKHVILQGQDQEYHHTTNPGMPYGMFIKEITLVTGIPVKHIHANVLGLLKTDLNGDSDYLSEASVDNLKREFKRRFDEMFAQSYQYKKLDFQAKTSIYNPEIDDFVEDVNAEVLGVKVDKNAISDDRYLYDVPPVRYDSLTPERDLIRHKYHDNISVFGKLPKRSIQVPKYTGGTTTPDFVYVVEKEDNTSVYLLVETKAEDIREEEQKTIEIQEHFFHMLREYGVNYKKATSAQQVYAKLRDIMEDK